MRRNADLVSATLSLVAVLAAFGIAVALRAATGFAAQNVVLAVVLTLTLGRTLSRATHHPVLLALEIPVVGLAAGGAGWLVLHEPWVGQPMLVLALCLGIFARRYGGLVRQAGRLLALPFLALLVTPAPRLPSTVAHSAATVPAAATILWAPVVGVLALACAAGANALRVRLLHPDAPPPDPVAATTRRRRLDAPTRMAVQMGVGLGSALLLGHLLFGEHWAWTVLSAFIVASGNRGRGDVVHKAALRVLGAAIGTVAATGLALSLPVGNRWTLVALFAVLWAGSAVRRRNYACWAAAVTAMIALLHAYYGDTATSALQERVLGVLLGSLLGVAAAWFVLPVRTADVVRRRVADCLAALTDELDPRHQGPSAVQHTLHRLEEITPTLRAHRRSLGRREPVHAVDAAPALRRLADCGDDEQVRRQLRRDVVRVRRALTGRDDPTSDELLPDLAVVHAVLRSTARPPDQRHDTGLQRDRGILARSVPDRWPRRPDRLEQVRSRARGDSSAG